MSKKSLILLAVVLLGLIPSVSGINISAQEELVPEHRLRSISVEQMPVPTAEVLSRMTEVTEGIRAIEWPYAPPSNLLFEEIQPYGLGEEDAYRWVEWDGSYRKVGPNGSWSMQMTQGGSFGGPRSGLYQQGEDGWLRMSIFFTGSNACVGLYKQEAEGGGDWIGLAGFCGYNNSLNDWGDSGWFSFEYPTGEDVNYIFWTWSPDTSVAFNPLWLDDGQWQANPPADDFPDNVWEARDITLAEPVLGYILTDTDKDCVGWSYTPTTKYTMAVVRSYGDGSRAELFRRLGSGDWAKVDARNLVAGEWVSLAARTDENSFQYALCVESEQAGVYWELIAANRREDPRATTDWTWRQAYWVDPETGGKGDAVIVDGNSYQGLLPPGTPVMVDWVRNIGYIHATLPPGESPWWDIPGTEPPPTPPPGLNFRIFLPLVAGGSGNSTLPETSSVIWVVDMTSMPTSELPLFFADVDGTELVAHDATDLEYGYPYLLALGVFGWPDWTSAYLGLLKKFAAWNMYEWPLDPGAKSLELWEKSNPDSKCVVGPDWLANLVVIIVSFITHDYHIETQIIFKDPAGNIKYPCGSKNWTTMDRLMEVSPVLKGKVDKAKIELLDPFDGGIPETYMRVLVGEFGLLTFGGAALFMALPTEMIWVLGTETFRRGAAALMTNAQPAGAWDFATPDLANFGVEFPDRTSCLFGKSPAGCPLKPGTFEKK